MHHCWAGTRTAVTAAVLSLCACTRDATKCDGSTTACGQNRVELTGACSGTAHVFTCPTSGDHAFECAEVTGPAVGDSTECVATSCWSTGCPAGQQCVGVATASGLAWACLAGAVSNGGMCEVDADCGSRHCTNGVCCASGNCCPNTAACGPPEYHCIDPTHCIGTVTTAECPTDGPNQFSCVSKATSDPGACAFQTCRAATCASGSFTAAAKCTNTGTCPVVAAVPCATGCADGTSCAPACYLPFDPTHVWATCSDGQTLPITTEAGIARITVAADATTLTLDEATSMLAYLSAGDVHVLDLVSGADRVVALDPDLSTARSFADIVGLSLEGGKVGAVLRFTCTEASSASCSHLLGPFTNDVPILIDPVTCLSAAGPPAHSKPLGCSPWNDQIERVLAIGASVMMITHTTPAAGMSYRIYALPAGSLELEQDGFVSTAVARGTGLLFAQGFPAGSPGPLTTVTLESPTATVVDGSPTAVYPRDGLDATDRVVVWASGGTASSFDRTTHAVVDLPSPSGHSSKPHVQGNLVAREEAFASGVDVYVYDLATNTDVAVATMAADEKVLGVTAVGVCWYVGTTVYCDTTRRP